MSPNIQQYSMVNFILDSNMDFYQDSISKDLTMQSEVLMFATLHTCGISFQINISKNSALFQLTYL